MSPAATTNAGVTGSPNAVIAIAAPMKGAVEKYAPVRAAPNPRRARMKSTRLTP